MDTQTGEGAPQPRLQDGVPENLHAGAAETGLPEAAAPSEDVQDHPEPQLARTKALMTLLECFPSGSVWPLNERRDWLNAMAAFFRLRYGAADGDQQIEVIIWSGATPITHPLPWGEARGPNEICVARTHPAAQTDQTERSADT